MTSIAGISSTLIPPLRDTAHPDGRHVRPDRETDRPGEVRPNRRDIDPARLRHALADRADRPDVNPARLRHALAERTDQHRDRPDIPGRIRHAIADRIDQHTDRPVDPRRVRHAVAERIDRNVDRPSRDDRSNRVRPVDLRV